MKDQYIVIPIAVEYHFLYYGFSMKLMHKLKTKTIDTAKSAELNFSLIPVYSIIFLGIDWA